MGNCGATSESAVHSAIRVKRPSTDPCHDPFSGTANPSGSRAPSRPPECTHCERWTCGVSAWPPQHQPQRESTVKQVPFWRCHAAEIITRRQCTPRHVRCSKQSLQIDNPRERNVAKRAEPAAAYSLREGGWDCSNTRQTCLRSYKQLLTCTIAAVAPDTIWGRRH